MNDPLSGLRAAFADIESAWPHAATGDAVGVAQLSEARLIAANKEVGRMRRYLDDLQASLASEIARQSRPELGNDSLAKKQGFRTPVALIAATTGGTNTDAAQFVTVGKATAPRTMLTGEDAPAAHPHVAAALKAGAISMRAASMIVRMLDRVAMRSSIDARDTAERLLAEQAAAVSLDDLPKIIARAEAHLDPDGLEPKMRDLRGQRSLRTYQRDGMLHLDGAFDPESAAPLLTALQGIVTRELRNEGRGSSTGHAGTHPGAPDATDAPLGDPHAWEQPRTITQRQADALVQLAEHALGCDSDTPTGGATVIVRIDVESLESGRGSALVDGIDQPVSVESARRMASSGGVIPCVLGDRSDVLDWGREKRLFTTPQKLALAERDGGCAGCGLPPGMTKAHHIRWWARDGGATDLWNGVLLCESCHHRVHDNGWDIRIDGRGVAGKVWFIPPEHVDPARTPRLGGRARFDYLGDRSG